jgi:hypothetical protein
MSRKTAAQSPRTPSGRKSCLLRREAQELRTCEGYEGVVVRIAPKEVIVWVGGKLSRERRVHQQDVLPEIRARTCLEVE